MNMPKRMKFGSFLGPFHRVGENPTLALDRDLELIDWMDNLGFDEVWVGTTANVPVCQECLAAGSSRRLWKDTVCGDHHSVVSIAYFGRGFSVVLCVGSDRNAAMGKTAGLAGVVSVNGLGRGRWVSYPGPAKWLYSSK